MSPAFDRFIRLLEGELEPLRYQACDLLRRYGETYARDAVLILGKLDEFARLGGEDLETALRCYASHIEQTIAERRRYRDGTGAYGKTEQELAALWSDERHKRLYLYVLTVSTVLNRARYELLRDFRAVLARFPQSLGAILEVGAGNCLSSSLASAYGTVTAYERNDLSESWRRILDPQGRIDLRLEPYRFAEASAYDLAIMIEVLEHVAEPWSWLQGAHEVLRESGMAYVTFAIRMPQADHLYEFKSVDECRAMIDHSAFHLWHEQCLIDTYYPFEEEERWLLVDDESQAVVYCCLIGKNPSPDAGGAVHRFTERLDT